jgi:hypothetical protein
MPKTLELLGYKAISNGSQASVDQLSKILMIVKAPENTLSLGDTFHVTSLFGTGGTFTYEGTVENRQGKTVGFIGVNAAGQQIVFSNSPERPGATLTIDPSGTTPICFMAGTHIRTPEGEVAVESLVAGDMVCTADGGVAPVLWLGRQTISTTFGDPAVVMPVRIRAGALGDGLPVRDLLLSPDHALLIDGVMVQAGALVNGRSIVRETVQADSFVYYHVELANHALVLAEGVPAETFIDNVQRRGFDNGHERVLSGDELEMTELDYPRAKSSRQVPPSTQRRLAAFAAAMEAGTVLAA